MEERGVAEGEVIAAIREGEPEATRGGRTLFRKNFAFGKAWRGKHYAVKQVAPVVAVEPERMVVVTVYAFYF